MRLTLLLTSILALTACSHHGANDSSKRDNMDSPIIVSDGSTRVHEKSGTLSGNVVTKDGTARKVDCTGNNSFGCGSIDLNSGWKIEVLNASGTIVTLYNASDQVKADFGNNSVTSHLDFDTENFLHTYYETSSQLQSFVLTNPPAPLSTYSCTPPGNASTGHKCRFKIY